MQRLNDHFLDTLVSKITLKGKHVLEIGCGNGKKSPDLAARCSTLQAIDPSLNAILEAQHVFTASNLTYSVGSAENLDFPDAVFDLSIFSLSFHHVVIERMETAITEVLRVTKKGGRLVFLEPAFNGTFFEAEVRFGASDGDERKEKAAAHLTLLSSLLLSEEFEFYDEIKFVFESEEDFIDAMEPSKKLSDIRSFLTAHNYTLTAQRRINIYSAA